MTKLTDDDDYKSNRNPFSLPDDGQLFSYWHYKRNATLQPPSTKKSSRKLIPQSKRSKSSKKNLESEIKLIQELRTKGLQFPFSKTSYVEDHRSAFKYRLYAAFRQDVSIKLDHDMQRQKAKFIKAEREHALYKDLLDKFLAADHEKSMKMLYESEAKIAETEDLNERKDQLMKQLGQARLQIYHWDEVWEVVKTCYIFLLKASPLNVDLPADDGSSRISLHSKRTHDTSTQDLNTRTSLETLIAQFEEDVHHLKLDQLKSPSELGLANAEDFAKIFQRLEDQIARTTFHWKAVEEPILAKERRIEGEEAELRTEFEELNEDIERLGKAIKHEERMSRRLEDRSVKLIQNEFRELVCAEEVLKMQLLIEDAYTYCIGENEAELDHQTLAKQLEKTYEKLNEELKKLPPHIVKRCEREGFRREMREAKEAEEAARKHAAMKRLLAALERTMQPSLPRTRILMQRSQPLEAKEKKKNKKILNT